MALHTHEASARFRGASPWTLADRFKMLLWEYSWVLLCQWTPKPFNAWRIWVLKRFHARIHGAPFVHQRARIQVPWHVEIRDEACIGDRANLYSLDQIVIGERAVIAQEAYLCTGTHDFNNPALPLQTAPIKVEAGAFVGARAMILAGVTVGRDAIVGAASVVTRDVQPGTRVVGNPARAIRM